MTMDKTTLIARAAQEPEDRLLLARVLDKYEQCQRKNIPAATSFLSPREQAMAQSLLAAAGVRDGFLSDGGYQEAERKILVFLPDWADAPPEEELAFLRASFRGPDSSLTHRDILGSLMGLGVERDRLGDILVSAHSADIVAAASLRNFFLREWGEAGRVRLTVTEIGREDLEVPQAQVKTVRDTVSSLRLDAVAASGFRLARGKAAALIESGKVQLNWRECVKPDKPLEAGDVVSARGFGKFELAGVGGLTRKGRISIVLQVYV